MKEKRGIILLSVILLILLISFVSAEIIDRGANWNKIDHADGSYNLEIYNNIINYFDGVEYKSINYGSCGSYCFKDWNGFIYRVSNDEKKSYINLYDINNNYISSFGFGITGDRGGGIEKFTTLNFAWIWSQEHNTTTNEYIFRAHNNNTNFNWTQEFHFYPNQSMKINNTIRNNLGVSINNAKFWYIQTVGQNDGIWFNGTKYSADIYKTGNFDSLLPQIKFEDYYVFEYDDLLENGFNITDFYLGDGNVIGVNGIRILAIGITKGNSVFPIGVSVSLDPTIKIGGDNGGEDAYVGSEGNANKNFGSENLLQTGTTRRTYMTFNISILPDNQKIDDSILCLYVTNTKKNQLINIYQVYSSWVESLITWNNQPCGINFDNSSACNLTSESSFQMNSALEYTWICWNITQMTKKSYSDGNKNISFVLSTSDSLINSFYSREQGVFSPYLNITYHLSDIIPPNISIISPNKNYTTTNIFVNISAQDANLQSIWFYNGTANVSYTTASYYNFPQGTNILTAYANDTVGNINSTSVTFFVDSVSPTINIIHPEAKTYGINAGLSLNFTVSDSGIGTQSCWYNLNGEGNFSLINCQNITFNTTDGSHSLYLFSNDSLGNENSDSVNFNVITTAPAINLISPANNSYLNYKENIYLNYTVDSGLEISSCQLFGDFNGIWQLNQTNSSTQIGINNYFLISNLSDGIYGWGILCNDSQNRISMKNYTFTIDTIAPSVILMQPAGTKSSDTNILLEFNATDNNSITCIYNVFKGVLNPVPNTSINCSFSSTNFDALLGNGNYLLNFYANDSANNLNFTSSSFSVSITSPGGGSGSGGGGGGGGRSSTTIIKELNTTTDLILNKISGLVGEPGENKKVKLKVKNTGTQFLNECKLKGYGNYSSWISGGETKNLAAGEEFEFEFDVNIPTDILGGGYLLDVSLICKEINKISSFSVELINKQLDFRIIEVKRIDENNVKIVYSIEELSGIDQNINIQFLFFGKNKEKITEIQEQAYVSANSKKEFESMMSVDSSLSGDLTLLINLNSETYSTFVEENVVLGKARLGGFAIFGDIVNSDNFIAGLLIILFLGFAFFIIRRIFSHKKFIKINKVIKKINESAKNKNY